MRLCVRGTYTRRGLVASAAAGFSFKATSGIAASVCHKPDAVYKLRWRSQSMSLALVHNRKNHPAASPESIVAGSFPRCPGVAVFDIDASRMVYKIP